VNADVLPPRLLRALARVGAATIGAAGPAGVRERLGMAEAGRLAEDEAEKLAAELDALAGLLAGR
jgi:hypothetical protein